MSKKKEILSWDEILAILNAENSELDESLESELGYCFDSDLGETLVSPPDIETTPTFQSKPSLSKLIMEADDGSGAEKQYEDEDLQIVVTLLV